MTIKAIETKYKGYRFRSRLEARWAVFFDAIPVEWRYEPEGFDLGEELGYYLPDFYLPKFKTWAEVKPEIPNYDSVEAKKLCKVAISQSPDTIPVFLGQIGETFLAADDLSCGLWKSVSNQVIHNLLLDHNFRPGAVLCPICKGRNVHIKKSINKDDIVVIPMWCENVHKWEVDFRFDHGETYLSLRNPEEWVMEDFAFILSGRDKYVLEAAVIQAKSARFEHGESPRRSSRRR